MVFSQPKVSGNWSIFLLGYFSLLMYLMMSWMFVVPVMMMGDGVIVGLLCWVLYVADGFNDCGCEDGGGDRE